MAARTIFPRKTTDKNCNEITAIILDYLTGKLSPSTKRAFEQHLRICPDCIAFLNTYKKTVTLSRSLRYEDVPTDVRRRVRSVLKSKIGAS